MKEQKTVRLPITVMLLLVGTMAFGAITGAFMYATGDSVIENGFSMQMVSHTEYRFSEPGQIVARLVDYQGSAITVDNCTATILYPDKSIFVNEALMSESTNITGDHYYQFTTPSGPEGVYEYQATCTWNGGARTQSVTNSFHLSSAFNSVLGNLSVIVSNQEAINTTLQDMSAVLDAVNVTTVNTYDYLTGTLANNVQQILDDLGIMNATLNRVEANTLEINATTQQILQNQQDEVYMTTFSG